MNSFAFSSLCIGLLALLLCPYLQAQEFQFSNWRIQEAVHDTQLNSKILLLSYEYRALRADKRQRLAMLPLSYSMGYGQEEFFRKDELLYLPIPQGDSLGKGSLRIAYSDIELYGGMHRNILLKIESQGKELFAKQIDFRLPPRYQIELELHYAEVKKGRRPWDKGNPKQALPDPYSSISRSNSEYRLAESELRENNWHFAPGKFRFTLLQGESFEWVFWDEDGEVDTELARIRFPAVQSDFQKRERGSMKGSVRALDYSIAIKQLQQQPITLYFYPDYQHEGRRGALVDVHYAVSAPFIGQVLQPKLQAFDADMRPLALSELSLLALDHGDSLQLGSRGQCKYFIPFYAWNPNTKYLHYKLYGERGSKLEATPCIVYNRYEPGSYLKELAVRAEEDSDIEGLQGAWLELVYQVEEVQSYGKWLLQITDSTGQSILPKLYRLDTKGKLQNLANKETLEFAMKASDSLRLFLPYAYWNGSPLRFKSRIALDAYQLDVEAQTLHLKGPSEKTRPIGLQNLRHEEYAFRGQYGMVVELDLALPELFLNKYQLQYTAWQNRAAFQKLLLHSEEIDSWAEPLGSDSARVYALFPYRFLENGDSLRLNFYLRDQGGQKLGEHISWEGRAALVLYNYKLEIELKKLRLDKKLVPSGTARLEYRVGNKPLQSLPIEAHRLAEESFIIHNFQLHREDQLGIYIVYEQGEQLLWRGKRQDIQALRKGKLQLSKQGPVKQLQLRFY